MGILSPGASLILFTAFAWLAYFVIALNVQFLDLPTPGRDDFRAAVVLNTIFPAALTLSLMERRRRNEEAR